jgi:arylsulfatase A-like enzyme
MLTGLYPSHHGVKSHETRLPEHVETLAETLRSAGFTTLAVVNTHNLGAPQFGLQQGFERFEYVNEVSEDEQGRIINPNTGASVLATARRFLAERPAEKPFFLFVHLYDVHTDFDARADLRREFVQPYTGKLTGRGQQLTGVRNRGQTLGEVDLTFLRQMYEAEIKQCDELLGEFLAWLGAQGLADETLLVVTSDHGEEFQEHGGLLHGRTQYQEVMRVPLIVAGPGVPAGREVATPVNGVDVAPTLLAALGVEARARRDGIDLAPAWRGGELPARTFFAEADHNNKIDGRDVVDIKKMVREGNAKLLYDTHTRRAELYDLAHDPLERTDLAAREPERAGNLRAELERYLSDSITSEAIAPPTAEEQRALDALGYGGDSAEDVHGGSGAK